MTDKSKIPSMTCVRYYYDVDQDEDFEDPFHMPNSTAFFYEHNSVTAQEAAKDYFHNHGGWEGTWPMTIVLESVNGYKSSWSVDMETMPEFIAYKM